MHKVAFLWTVTEHPTRVLHKEIHCPAAMGNDLIFQAQTENYSELTVGSIFLWFPPKLEAKLGHQQSRDKDKVVSVCMNYFKYCLTCTVDCRFLIKPPSFCIESVIMWDRVAVWCFSAVVSGPSFYPEAPTYQHKQAGCHTHMQLHTYTLLPGTLNTTHSPTKSSHFQFSTAKCKKCRAPIQCLKAKPLSFILKIERLKGPLPNARNGYDLRQTWVQITLQTCVYNSVQHDQNECLVCH